MRLFNRRVSSLTAQRKYTELLEALAPWDDQPWSNFKPTLGGLYSGGKRMPTFKKCLFDKVICVLVLKGEEQSSRVKELCEQCLARACAVDTVLLDNVGAVTLDESCCIWNALVGIISDSLSPFYVEPIDMY